MADFSTSNGPHSQPPLPTPPSPLLLLSNMSNLLPIKFDSVNYIVWKLQLTTILDAYSMIDHIDGSVQKPSQYLVDTDGNFTLIYSTLSPPILAMWLDCTLHKKFGILWNKGSPVLLELMY